MPDEQQLAALEKLPMEDYLKYVLACGEDPLGRVKVRQEYADNWECRVADHPNSCRLIGARRDNGNPKRPWLLGVKLPKIVVESLSVYPDSQGQWLFPAGVSLKNLNDTVHTVTWSDIVNNERIGKFVVTMHVPPPLVKLARKDVIRLLRISQSLSEATQQLAVALTEETSG